MLLGLVAAVVAFAGVAGTPAPGLSSDRAYFWRAMVPAALEAGRGAAVVRVLRVGPPRSNEDDRAGFKQLEERTGQRIEVETADIKREMLVDLAGMTNSVDIIHLNLFATPLSADSLRPLVHEMLAAYLKPGGVLVVERNYMSELCCSNVAFALEGFTPAALEKGLPTRRRFQVAEGHVVLDVLRNGPKLTPTFADPSLDPHETVINVALTMNFKKYLMSIRQLKKSSALATEAAETVCGAYEKYSGFLSAQAECKKKLQENFENFLIIGKREKARHKCLRRRLMIVAHPGDELLFGGRALLGDPACWTVVVATSEQEEQDAQKPKFHEAMSMVGAEGYVLPYLEGDTLVPFQSSAPVSADGTSKSLIIEDWIYFWAGLLNWDRIVTHGPLGECR
eukprot:g694.t1